jgi:hypothetical protein
VTILAVLVMPDEPLISDEQLSQFNDVKGWLAALYLYCLEERGLIAKSKHRKSEREDIKRRLDAIRDYRITLPPDIVHNNINMWHTWMIVYVLMFHENGWKDLVYQDLPKLDNYILVELVNDKLFDGRPVADIAKEFKIRAKEKNVLKDFALRLSP